MMEELKFLRFKPKILLITACAIVILIAIYWRNQLFDDGERTSRQRVDGQSYSVSKSLRDVKIVGWTAYWDEKNTLASLGGSATLLASFSPILYKIESDGSLGRIGVLYKREMLELARINNLAIIPVIGDDFDFERVDLLLNDEGVQKKFIQQLVAEAKKENFAGWSIDIESLDKEDKKAFTKFIESMSKQLHENNLKSNVIVFGRIGDDENPSALAQDYKALGEVTDELQIMMYGAHDEDTKPGGQAPLSWVRKVLDYTTRRVPREKTVVGLSAHGYDWGGKSAEPLTFAQIEKRIYESTGSATYSKEESSAIFKYQKDGHEREIWFEDATAIKQKMNFILDEFGVDKFAIWRIGAEDPRFWEELKNEPR